MKKFIFITTLVFLMVVGCNNELQWSEIYHDEWLDWNDAINYCKNLNENGYNDWRLPNIDELRTLIQVPQTITGGACQISDKAGKLSMNYYTEEGCSFSNHLLRGMVFWSSSTVLNNTDFAWGADFYAGIIGAISKSNRKTSVHFSDRITGVSSKSNQKNSVHSLLEGNSEPALVLVRCVR